MRSRSITLAAAFMVVATGTKCLSLATGETPRQSDDQARIDTLTKHRIDVLSRAVQLRMQQYQDGGCDFQEVLMAQLQLNEAQLDAARTPQERIAALERQLEVADQSLKHAKRRFQSGQLAEVGVLQEEAARLTIEIRLLREKDSLTAQSD